MASKAIDDRCRAMEEYFNAGNIEAMTDLYTEDCRFVLKGTIAVGHAGMMEEMAKLCKDYDQLKFAHDDRTMSGDNSGDLSTEAGKCSIRNRATEKWEEGVYCCTWMKGKDGKWRARYDCTIV